MATSKIEQFKLALRNAVNKATGQQKQINEYNKIVRVLSNASDKEKDPEKKQKILDTLDTLIEERWTNHGSHMTVSTFNQYKPLQSGKLAEKIKSGYKLMQEFKLQIQK